MQTAYHLCLMNLQHNNNYVYCQMLDLNYCKFYLIKAVNSMQIGLINSDSYHMVTSSTTLKKKQQVTMLHMTQISTENRIQYCATYGFYHPSLDLISIRKKKEACYYVSKCLLKEFTKFTGVIHCTEYSLTEIKMPVMCLTEEH